MRAAADHTAHSERLAHVSDEQSGKHTRRWFMTFPQRLSTRNCYRVVLADTYDDARHLAFAHHGQCWAFVYPIEELAEQIDRFHLSEVTPPLRDDWGRP